MTKGKPRLLEIKKRKGYKRIIACTLVVLISICAWFFTMKLPDIYLNLGKSDYSQKKYVSAYKNLKTSLFFNKSNKDARYFYVKTLLALKPDLQVQQEIFKLSQGTLNDSADLIADRQISKWKNEILNLYSPNYIERTTFDGKILRWDVQKFPIKVYVKNNSEKMPYANEEIKNAFFRWKEASGGLLNFEFVQNSNKANILIEINSSQQMKKCSEKDCKYAVAYTIPTVNGDFLERMNITFYDSNNLGAAFSAREVFNTAVHEIGHALGIMGHSQNKDDIMYMQGQADVVYAPYRSDFQVFSAADINTLKLLYKLNPQIINSTPEQIENNGLILPAIILGDGEKITSAKIIEAQNYIQAAPDLPNGYLDLANAYVELKQYEKAVETLEKAVALCSNDEERFAVYYNLSITYADAKDWQNALKYAQLAKSHKQEADVDGLIAVITLNSGDKELAKKIYKETVQKNPSNIIDSINLAVIYLRDFDFINAGKVLNNLIKANPEAASDPRVK